MGLGIQILSRLSRSSRSGIVTVLAAAAPLLVLAAPAAAAPAAPASAGPAGAAPVAGAPQPEAATAAPAAGTSGPHCALAAGDHQPLRCFATFPAAVAFATGGRVTAPASAADAARDPGFAASVEAAATLPAAGTATSAGSGGVLVGIEYADLNYGGATLSMFAPGGCDYSLDVDYRFTSLPAGWNDRISSFRSYSNCAQQLFNAINFGGGSLTGIISSLAYVGSAANDKASSVTFN
jgi:hypothetical protein